MANKKTSDKSSEKDKAADGSASEDTPKADPLHVPEAPVPDEPAGAESARNRDADGDGTSTAGDAPETETGKTEGADSVPVFADDTAMTAEASPWDKKPEDAEAATEGEDGSSTADDTVAGSGSDDDTTAADRIDTEGESAVNATPDAGGDTGTPAAAAAAPQAVRETVVERRGGFFPVLLGGILAAGAGYLAAQYESGDWPFATATTEDPFRTQTEAALQSQQTSVDDLTSRLGVVEGAIANVDDSATEAALSGLTEQVDALNDQIATLSEQQGLLEVRVVNLEKAPVADTVSPDAIAAYERELDALRAEISEQRVSIENMAQEAVAAEQNASAQAELARARAALAELTAALDSGQPFQQSVTEIMGVDEVAVPDALTATASEGVPTQAALLDSYPDAARAALQAARAGEDGTISGGLGGFLRSQLGARSVAPREGDDPDAVLSRAEAALKAGELQTALTEIETLPEEAKAAMSDWITSARMRAQAQSAVNALSQELNTK